MPEAGRVVLRAAGPADADLIADLHARSWQSAYRGIYPDDYLDRLAGDERRTFWRERFATLDANQDAVFVAEQEGRAAGFACIRRRIDPKGPLLDNLHVLPDCKGRGIGRRLIRQAAAWLAAKDADAPLQLLVWAANHPARDFYRKLGGEEVEEFEGDLPHGATAPEIRMRWNRAATLAEAPELYSKISTVKARQSPHKVTRTAGK